MTWSFYTGLRRIWSITCLDTKEEVKTIISTGFHMKFHTVLFKVAFSVLGSMYHFVQNVSKWLEPGFVVL